MFKTIFSWVCKSILFVTGWSLKTHPDYKDVDRQVVVFPHTSGWELVLAWLCQHAYHIKNTKLIVWNGQFTGLTGVLLKWFGCIPIENNKSTGAVKTISDYLNSQGKFKFCISPEGSRSFREKFRSGFYHIAQNTNSIYNIVLFDYEKHVVNFGYLLPSTNNFESDCHNITRIFSKSVPLYPEETFYNCTPHSHTSMVDWLCLSNVTGLLNTWLLWQYHHPWFAGMSLVLTTVSFLYHNSKETLYRSADWLCAGAYILSLCFYRWYYTGVIWKLAILLSIVLVIFLQAGENKRYKNENYRKWHVLYHLSTFPIAVLEIWLHT